MIKFLNKHKTQLGLTLLEALMATAIVGIGFVAVFNMVTFSVQSIDTSAERTKANYLVSMIAEDIIGHKNTIYGANVEEENIIFNAEGKPEAWYDPAKPVAITFTKLGGSSEKIEGVLPLHKSVVFGGDEYRFSILSGKQSFVTISATRCNFP